MTTVFLLLSFPIGILFLLSERRNRRENEAIFQDYIQEVMDNPHHDEKERIRLIRHMFDINHYRTESIENGVLTGSKKEFSIGMMFVGIGTAYVGLIVYLVYFFYFKKPSILRVDINKKEVSDVTI